MKYILDSGRKGLDLQYTLVSKRPDNVLRTTVTNSENGDIILERTDVMGISKKGIVLKLPLTPKSIVIETFNMSNGKLPLGMDQSFSIETPKKLPLKTFNVELGTGDIEFLEFAEKFVQDLPVLQPNGMVRRSKSGTFKIVLFDRLKSRNGENIPSPCLVGSKSGTIEVSKHYFLKMSQEQRMATLCHEYAHFYKNPLLGYKFDNEYGADLNGMTIYLGRGYALSEYINAFKKIFNGAASDLNRKRYKVMKGFAQRIFNGEYFGKPYNL